MKSISLTPYLDEKYDEHTHRLSQQCQIPLDHREIGPALPLRQGPVQVEGDGRFGITQLPGGSETSEYVGQENYCENLNPSLKGKYTDITPA